MKWVKLTVLVLIVLLILIFVVQNVGQPVKLVFFSKDRAFESDMIFILLITLVIGILMGFIFSIFQVMSAKNKLRVIITEYKKLQKELNLLRNVDVEDIETEESN